ncbi:MAG: hypothetical protein I8H67_13695 [Comamonadaceae bacterium]|nr:hypothetical protein [Comamonadaceae bacterium]
MGFDRHNLPEPLGYFEGQGLKLSPRGKWRTTSCTFHAGSDSMRINTATGAWVCMSCDAKGGDVLAYEMQAHGLEFIEAAKALGAWTDDGKPVQQHKPSPLSARQALQVLATEANLAAIAAGNVARGIAMTDLDLARLMTASNRITRLVEVFA